MDEYNDLNLKERAFKSLKERKERVETGRINAIPNPFKRFGRYMPGTERGKYIVVTANQKVGKSKLADFLYIYDPFFKMIMDETLFRLKVLYFTLEMSPEEKFYEFLSYLLKEMSDIRISPADLKSTNRDRPLDSAVLNLLESDEYQRIINRFTETVEFIDDVANPTGIYQYCWNWATREDRGNLITKRVEFSDEAGRLSSKEVITGYVPNDEDEYRIIIVDNASNIQPERGESKLETIQNFSKKAIRLRKTLGYTVVLIQHQAQQQEGIDNLKLGQMAPTAAGLADYKGTIRDVNIAFGIYSPFKFGVDNYQGYDITRLQNNVRFLSVIDDRDYGTGGMIIPLFFDGATAEWWELPKAKLPDGRPNPEMEEVYRRLNEIRGLGVVHHIYGGKYLI